MEAIFSGPWGPLFIFALRVADVSLATLRIMLAVRGQRVLVPILGFVEITIWVFAAGNVIRHLESPLHILGYALGFTAGTVVGMWLEGKLAFGVHTVQIISRRPGPDLADLLRSLGCGATEFAGQGRDGPVTLVYTVVPRKSVARMIAEVEKADPDAFIAVEDSREIRRGWMPGLPRLRGLAPVPGAAWAKRERGQLYKQVEDP